MPAHHHNLMRLWAWEKVRRVPGTDTDPDDFYFTPPVYPRPGLGKALDGGPSSISAGRPSSGEIYTCRDLSSWGVSERFR